MSSIVLNEDQAKLLVNASGPVEFRDPSGNLLVRIDVPPPEEVAEVRRRIDDHHDPDPLSHEMSVDDEYLMEGDFE